MSDIITNFANMQSQRVNPLSKLGTGISGIAGILKQKKLEEQQALAAEQAKLAYDNALMAWQADPSLENQTALWQATPEGMQKGLSSLFESASEEEKLGKIQFYNDILGYASAGEIDLAIESALAGSKAFNTADPRNAKISATIAEKLKEGDIQGAQTFINQMLMSTPEGQELLGTRIDMDTSERADKQLILDEKTEERLQGVADREQEKFLLDATEQIMDMNFDSDDQRDKAVDILEKTGSIVIPELISEISRVGQLQDAGDMTPAQINSAVQSWRNQYIKETGDYTRVNSLLGIVDRAADTAMGKTGANQEKTVITNDEGEKVAVGIYDLALINSFQRMIDDATVRESDISNIRTSAGGVAAMQIAIEKFFGNGVLSDEMRRGMKDMASQINDMYAAQEEDIRNTILESTRKLPGVSDTQIVGNKVFTRKEQPKETPKNIKEEEAPVKGLPKPVSTGTTTDDEEEAEEL